jgi:hypothetical protein
MQIEIQIKSMHIHSLMSTKKYDYYDTTNNIRIQTDKYHPK